MKRTRRGFTLLECACAIVVIGVTAAAVLPALNASTDMFVATSRARETCDNVAYAMDRTLAMLRDTRLDEAYGTAEIGSASLASISFTDGRSLSLTGTTLMLSATGSPPSPLLRDVEVFEIGLFGQDGVTSTMGSPGQTWLYTVRIKVGGFELSGRAFIRARSMPA